jgi:hypothetical protein
MIMCHMVADSLGELHFFARRLSLKPEWFQDKPGRPHYDVSKNKREAAVFWGAIETDERRIVEVAGVCAAAALEADVAE